MAALRHVQATSVSGSCVADRAPIANELMQPGVDVTCSFCGEVFDSLAAFQSHTASHFDPIAEHLLPARWRWVGLHGRSPPR
eukprot:11516294-Alexandrium_andersonii.AAC.1